MKEAVKMYHLFLPRRWFTVIIYILYPALIGLLGMCFFSMGSVAEMSVSIMLGTSLVVCAEYMLDVFMFAGVVAPGTHSLEYIKTSAKGVPLFQAALYGDGVRRLISTMLSYALLYIAAAIFNNRMAFVTVENNGSMVETSHAIVFVQCAIIALFCAELGMMYTRKTANPLLNLIVLYVMAGVAATLAMASVGFSSIITVGISLILYIVVWLAGRKFLVRKVRESFYDEGYKELL